MSRYLVVLLGLTFLWAEGPANELTATAAPLPLRITHLEYDSNNMIALTPAERRINTFYYGEAVTNLVFETDFPPHASAQALASDPTRATASDNAPARPTPQYQLQSWNLEHGLPHNKIRSLCQTRDGYLWIGNVTGLTRFDGVRFTFFSETNTPEMKGLVSIGRCLQEDDAGRLWIGTEGGLLCRAGGRFVNFPGEADLRGETINAVIRRSAGGIWIGTARAVGHWDGAGIHWLELAEITEISSLAETRNGLLWVGTTNALVGVEARSGRVHRILSGAELAPTFKTSSVYELQLDRQQRLWIGTSRGLARLDTPDAAPRMIHKLSHARLAHTARDTIWAAVGSEVETLRGNLLSLTERSGEFIPLHAAMTGPLSSLLVDREGVVWAGGRDGLVRLREVPITTMLFDKVGTTELRSLAIDSTGAVWLGCSYYFARWSGNRLVIFESLNLLPPATRMHRYPLLASQFGNMWASHGAGGIFELPRFPLRAAMPAPLKRQFAELGELRAVLPSERQGCLWLATSNRLFRAGSPTMIEVATEFSFPEIRSLSEDRQMNLWIGTASGLFQLNPSGNVSEYTNNVSGLHNAIIAQHRGDVGDLWLGTRAGLCRFANGEFQTFGLESGLPQDAIYGLLEDDAGRLWLNCDAGIVRVHREELRAWQQNQSRALVVSTFGLSDGLVVLKGRTGSQTAVKSRDGRLWFTKGRSVVVVDPTNRPTAPPPQVFIESVAVDDTGVIDTLATIGADLELQPGAGRQLEFQFTATSLHSPDRVLIRYQLEGHDPSWREAGSMRRASYTNVRPGSYQFRVQARNHEGRWSESDAVFTVRLLPYFWQTQAFLIACVLGTLGSVAGLTGWRLRRQRRQMEITQQLALETERVRIARDVHDHLGAQLTEAALVSGSPEEARRTARESLRQLNDLIWSVQPQNDTLRSLADFIGDCADRYLTTAGLAVELNLPEEIPALPIASSLRREVAAMFKEALRNAVQHARAETVMVSLKIAADYLIIHVQDDGQGFDYFPGATPSRPTSSGNGLRHLHERCAELGGTCRIVSSPGNGTRVEFSVPLRLKTG